MLFSFETLIPRRGFTFIIPAILLMCSTGLCERLERKPEVDVELKLTMPFPGVNGYIYAFGGNLGIQFNRLVATEFRMGRFSRELSDSSFLFAADLGLVPVIKDRRIKHRGWITQAGGSAGYAYENGGDGPFLGNPEADRLRYQYHYVTANLILKTTHWWRKHLGFIIQIRAVGGLSFYGELARTTYNDDYSFDSGYHFADSKLYGLRFQLGLAF